MEQATLTGMLRGMDSTGLFQVNKKGGFGTYKKGVSGDMFIGNKGAQRHYSKVTNSFATIIHNRAATRGEVSDDNAHPFIHWRDEEGKAKPTHCVVGVHNGTLFGSHPRKEDGREFDVDSDYLFYQICKKGHLEALKEVSGSYALVWYENNWNLRIAVNEERPLYWGFVKGSNAMLIASEAGMMCWLAERNGIKLDEIVAPEKNHVYTFDVRGKVREFTTEAVPARTIIPVVGSFSNFPHGQRGVRRAATNPPATDGSPGGSRYPTLRDFSMMPGDTAPFSVLGEVKESQRTIHGMIEAPNGDPMSAIMHVVTPSIVRHLMGCEFATVEVKSVYPEKETGEIVVVVGHPLEVVSTDDVRQLNVSQLDAFAELDDLDTNQFEIPNNMVKGPGGKPITLKTFNTLTEQGCIYCHQDCHAKDADKMDWVNMSNDPLCMKCVDDLKARTNERRSVRS